MTHPSFHAVNDAIANEEKTVEVDTLWVRKMSLCIEELNERYNDEGVWIKKTKVGRPNSTVNVEEGVASMGMANVQ